MKMKQVVILSSYGYCWEPPHRTTTCRQFLRALEDHSFEPGKVVEVEINHAGRLSAHREFLRRRLARRVDMIYAGSSSVMEAARDALAESGRRDIPLLYWGSHIVDQGKAINPVPRDSFIAGLQLEMPLYTSHRQFRLLKALLPSLRRIFCPFSVESAFYHAQMRDRHERAVRRFGTACWVDASSEYGGFAGLGQLAEIIGARFYEHPCSSAENLVKAIESLPPGCSDCERQTDLILNGIECFHIPGANEALVEAADQRGIPYIGLNFGSFHSQLGPLAIFTNDIDQAAYGVGKIAARILSGIPPEHIGVTSHNCFRFAYNLENARHRNHRLSNAAQRQIAKHFMPFEPKREALNAEPVS